MTTYLIGTNFRVALISRFSRFKKNREFKASRNFNVAKFNTLLYFLFSQFNEETHVYILCIMCKSFMVCLQMTNNSLTVEPLHLYRYRHLQVLSVPLLHSHRNGHLSRVLCNLKRHGTRTK